MNPEAILSLISDLYVQIVKLKARIAELEAEGDDAEER